MTDNIKNLLLEHLKRIQAEQSAARERDQEIITRLSHIKVAVARIGSNQASNYEELVADRMTVDKLIKRIERIEHRLELDV